MIEDQIANAINEVQLAGNGIRAIRVHPKTPPSDIWIAGVLETRLGEGSIWSRDRELMISPLDWFRLRDEFAVRGFVFDQDAPETLFGYPVEYA